MFNAFKFTKQLEEAGFSREQAEAQLQVIAEVVEGDLVTKQDLKNSENGLWTKIDARFEQVNARVDARFNHVDERLHQVDLRLNNFENKLQRLEYRLTIKIGTLFIVGFTTMASIMKFWLIH